MLLIGLHLWIESRYEIRQHSAWFLPSEVAIHKFCSTYVCAKDMEKHGDDGLVYVF